MYNTEANAIDALCAYYKETKNEIAKVIVGQDDVIKAVLIS